MIWQQRPELDHAIAGLAGGAVSSLALHPLDLIKTRLQLDLAQKKASNDQWVIWRTAKALFKEGRFHALYQGWSANLTGAMGSWAFYFYFYEYLKSKHVASDGSIWALAERAINVAGASTLAGGMTVVIMNPIWLVKTRLFAQTPSTPNPYTGLFSKTMNLVPSYLMMIDALYRIRKEEGFKALYRGLIPGLVGVSHGTVQFMVYEELKRGRRLVRHGSANEDQKLSTSEYLVLSSIAKLTATVVTYPYQMVRARQQFERPAKSVFHTIRAIYSGIPMGHLSTKPISTGILAFYKGLAPNAIRVLPGTWLTFATYEHTRALLREWRDSKKNVNSVH